MTSRHWLLLLLLVVVDCFGFGWVKPPSFVSRSSKSAWSRRASTKPDNGCVVASSIETIDLRQWGVFDQAQVNLTGRPLFAVVTGETGSGKSVMVNALEYLCFGSTKRSLFRPGSETSVAMRKGGDDLRRSYNAVTRRSLCEINGQKTTVKSLAEQMAGTVRFWSAEDNGLHDASSYSAGGHESHMQTSPGIFAYIDSFIGSDGLALLEQLRIVYGDWLQAHTEMQRLQSLERRVIQGNEAELLRHFSSELDALEGRLQKLLVELLGTVQDLDVLSFDVEGEEEEEEGEEAYYTSGQTPSVSSTSVSPLAELLQTLTDLSPPRKARKDVYGGEVQSSSGDGVAEVDLRKCWKALLLADKVFNSLARSMASAFPQSAGGTEKFVAPKNINTKSFDISDARQLDSLHKSLDDYGERLLSLQAGFKGLGLSGSAIDGKMEKAHMALQAAAASLRDAHSELRGVQEGLPDVSGALSRLVVLRAEWEALARKHGGISPPDMQRLRREWNDDLTSLSTMQADLPFARQAEEAARRKYCSLATALSERRRRAAALLSARVNALLPSLEMSDKLLLVELQDAAGQLLEPTSPRVTGYGWDDVRMSVASRLSGAGTGDIEGKGLTAGAALSTLSSGETARLSLALETCCLDGGGEDEGRAGEGSGPFESGAEASTVLADLGVQEDGGDDDDSGRGGGVSVGTTAAVSRSGLVIYDEIDAHIGGEAAVAVARLLRSQGRKLQVVAITHNPVVAAAADLHLVVRRGRGVGTDGAAARSIVLEVVGAEREAELARMATGRLDTTAGTDLARALLGAFAGAE